MITESVTVIISGSHVRHHDDLSDPIDKETSGKTPRPQVPTPRKSSPALPQKRTTPRQIVPQILRCFGGRGRMACRTHRAHRRMNR
jgi:hypothetical protein